MLTNLMFDSLLLRQVSQGVGEDLVQLGLAAHGFANQHDAVLNMDHLVKLERIKNHISREEYIEVLLSDVLNRCPCLNVIMNTYLEQACKFCSSRLVKGHHEQSQMRKF